MCCLSDKVLCKTTEPQKKWPHHISHPNILVTATCEVTVTNVFSTRQGAVQDDGAAEEIAAPY